MSVGLLAVLDDILTAATRASAKTAGVVIDDAAVTPQYVQGITPARELPVVAKIALGSLVNKFVIITPIALLLTAFAPWVLPYLLVIGGSFLCYEGAEKVLQWFGVGHHEAANEEEPRDEKKLVFGAVRTDLILSTEIMLIALASLEPGLSIWMTLVTLLIVGLLLTVVVYGAVALLVKVDDIGLRLMKSPQRSVRRGGARVVAAMPAVFRVISVVGTVAMLWVGGHIVIENLHATLWAAPYDLVHSITHAIEAAGAIVTWTVETIIFALLGLAYGLVIVGVITGGSKLLKRNPTAAH